MGYHDFCVDFAIFIHLNPEFTKMFEKSDNTCELNNNQPNCIVDTNGDVFLVDEDGVLLTKEQEEE